MLILIITRVNKNVNRNVDNFPDLLTIFYVYLFFRKKFPANYREYEKICSSQRNIWDKKQEMCAWGGLLFLLSRLWSGSFLL